MYKDIDKPEAIKGIKFWQNKKNKFHVLMLHYTADPNKDPDRNGKEWVKNEKQSVSKATWIKEYEIDFSTKAGELIYGKKYCDLSPEVHFISSMELPEPYELIMAVDFGQRNPTAALVAAVMPSGLIYIIDEFYKPGIPSKTSKNMFDKFSYLFSNYSPELPIDRKREMADEVFQIKLIDPTTRHKNRTKIIEGEEIPYSVIEDFYDNGWDFEPANNDVDAGITRVREFFSLQDKPYIYIFKDKCPHLIEELLSYRYQEHTEQSKHKYNASEKPMKKNDHCLSGDSIINTVNGDIPIKDLVGKTGYVYSYTINLEEYRLMHLKM